MIRILFGALALLTASDAAPLKILTIGDSLTDEYGGASRIVFSATATNPDHVIARNWVELLETFRADEIEFGAFADRGDLRSTGYQWNFGIVGTTTTNWLELVTTDSPFDIPDDDFAFNFLYYNTRNSLIDQLPAVDIVLIFLGGNDFKRNYSPIFNDTEDPSYLPNILNRLNLLHTFVRQQRPNVPIIVATVPDVGATPEVYSTYNVLSKQLATRAKIATFNENLAEFFESKTTTAVARVDKLTDQVLDIVLGLTPGPFHLNGYPFEIPGNPELSLDRVFTRDNFHPHTVAQALIANEIIHAINGFFPGAVTPFAHREILAGMLGFDPDQPYLDWVAPYALDAAGPDDDPDGDGLPNLAEMTLGIAPDTPSSPFAGSWPAGISWTPADTRYAALVAEESADLDVWTAIPGVRLSINGSQVTATPPPAAERQFIRFRATPRP